MFLGGGWYIYNVTICDVCNYKDSTIRVLHLGLTLSAAVLRYIDTVQTPCYVVSHETIYGRHFARWKN